MNLQIGYWIERESREIVENHTYYAADWRKVKTTPGKYPLILTFEQGYTIPMPYWLVVGIDATVVDGCLYSGFGGVNFASQPVTTGPTTYHVQMYAYELSTLLSAGRVELLQDMGWAEVALDAVKREGWTWEDIRVMAASVALRAAMKAGDRVTVNASNIVANS